MASPNGFFDCGATAAIDRNWWRQTITHDINSAPWLPGQAGNYEFEINIGTAALGPFTPAVLTSPGNECSPDPDNRLAPGGVNSTVFGVGGPTELLANTDYWLEIILHGPGGGEVDRFVCGPTHTQAYPVFTCLGPTTTQTTADVTLGAISGRTNITAPCNQDSIVWEIATAPGGPYTAAPSEPVVSFAPDHSFTGLTAGTTYYYRARLTEQAQTAGEYLVTPECSFTTQEAPVTTPPFNPQPCDSGGAGADAVDVEQILLCDTLPDGTIAGTAMAVWEYDAAGAPTGPPTFVDPATGTPYVAQGTLMPCPGETGCLEPVAFHRTTTATGPVDHPGRQYDITLPINPGFAVQSLQVDQVTSAANIVWDVADPDGEQFRQDLTSFIDARVPSAATVTVTNPNAGQVICGTAAPMQIHIECLRLDQSPPDLIELVYNGGQDLVTNPAYNETPPLNPPVSQGNYGFHLLGRQDNNTYPINQPANRANCTNVANRGWETNDIGRTFEIWGADQVNGQNVTPTPRGTPVQEMTSDGAPPGGLSTIWQTFVAPASANFIIRVVHGSRDPGETHRITLDNGDTDDAQNGDLIDDVTNPPSVTSNGGPNAWTQFSQTIPLNGGSTYTLALSTTNPFGANRGGLFTDMRAYIDRPDLRATATTDDDTCVVTVDETTTLCTDELWSPICEAGAIESWQNAETGAILSNAAFWGQAPAPVPGPCPAAASSGDGGSVAANLAYTYPVCATVGGVRTNLQRVVITDASGGVLADTFIGPDGGPVPTPSSYDIGSCTDTAFMNDAILCDDNGPFLRKFVQAVSDVGQPQVKAFGNFTLAGAAYAPVGTVRNCGGDTELVELCDVQPTGASIPFVRRLTYDQTGEVISAENQDADGNPYNPTGLVTVCSQVTREHEIVCDDNGPFLRTFVSVGGVSVITTDTLLDGTTPYAPTGTVRICDAACDPVTTTGLCLADGTPIGVVTRRDCDTGTLIQDGWINLLTGAFTAGPPPAGTMSCSSSQSVQVSGIFCDVDGNGDVQGLVLIEYHYAADGTIDSVRLVNATTGATYVPVGTVTTCPADVEQPDADLAILCDIQPDGSSIPFVRDYRRDQNNTITSVSNYTLAGAPYVPTGTVGTCSPTDCTNTTTLLVCDIPTDDPDGAPTVTNTNQQFIPDIPTADFVQRPGGGGALWTGGVINFGPDVSTGPGITQVHRYVAATLQAPAPACTDGTVHVSLSVETQNLGPGAGCSGAGRFRLFRVSDGAVLNAGSTLFGTPVGQTDVLTIEADIAATELDTGNVAVWLDVETFQTGTCAPPDGKQWQARNFTAAYAYNVDGCEIQFFRTVVTDCETGETLATVDTTPEGAPYVVTGEVGACTSSGSSGSPCPCVTADDIGQAVADAQVTADTETQILCDVNAGVATAFRRSTVHDATGTVVTVRDTNLAGTAAYVPTGTVGLCSGRDSESVILCDSAANPNRFIRTYTYNAAGAVTGFTDTTLAGAAFVPTGAVGVCAQTVQSDTDFVEEILCDSAGTAFIRLFRFNSTTGALISTTNTTLAGAAFAPVGAVGLCSDCCGTVIGNGCTNTGSGFYTAIRATNGTISLIDSVSGATILAASIVPCVDDDTPVTLTAQGRVLTNATPWTPGGDVAGTLTSLTVTGTSGLWDLVDANGTALTGLPAGLTLTWNAEDNNQLTGPVSVTPQAGATVVANWTQR